MSQKGVIKIPHLNIKKKNRLLANTNLMYSPNLFYDKEEELYTIEMGGCGSWLKICINNSWNEFLFKSNTNLPKIFL